MIWISYALHILMYLVPLFALGWRWWRQRGLIFDHVALFTIGFLFYFSLPVSLGYTTYFKDYVDYQMWERLFFGISHQRWIMYFLSALLFYLVFVLGDLVASWRGARRAQRVWPCDAKVQTYVLHAVLVIGMLGVVMYGSAMQSYFFKGYQTNTQFSALGSITAATVLLLTLAIYASAAKLRSTSTSISWWRILFHRFFAAYLLAEALLLSMGGRLVAITSAMMVLVLYSVYVRKPRIMSAAAVFVGLIAISHAILQLREGSLEYGFGFYGRRSIGLYFFSENYNLAYSLLDFLGKYTLPVLRFPVQLVSGLVSIIPSFLFPSKSNFIVQQLAFSVASPVGGQHMFVSLTIGFGILGALVFLFLLSYGLRRLRQRQEVWAMTAYVTCSGWLAMMFFRDVQQALIKTMFEFSLLAPLAIAVICTMVSRRLRRTS